MNSKKIENEMKRASDWNRHLTDGESAKCVGEARPKFAKGYSYDNADCDPEGEIFSEDSELQG